MTKKKPVGFLTPCQTANIYMLINKYIRASDKLTRANMASAVDRNAAFEGFMQAGRELDKYLDGITREG